MRWFLFLAFGAMVAAATSAAAASRCDQLLARLGNQVVNAADTTCFDSPDLTTDQPQHDAGRQFAAGPSRLSRLPRRPTAP